MEARRLSITDEYELLQIKVFSRWATNALKSREIVINNVTEDFCDGINLCYLAEVLTKKQAHRKIDLRAKLPIQKTMNCDLAIEMFTQDNVKLVGIGGKDIVDGNKKLTLGLIWTLILNYTIAAVQDVEEEPPKVEGEAPQPKKPKKSATQALMSWAVDNTEEYDNITNFRPLPLAMCALLNNYKPDVINFQSLNPRDMEGNAKLAMETCESLGVPLLLDWEDLVTGVDDKTLFTQLSYIKRELKKLPKQVVPKNGMIVPAEETAPAVVEPVKISPLDQVLLNWAHLKGLNSEVNDIGLVKTELPNLAINLLKTEDAAADPLKSFIDDGVKLSEDPESLLLSLVVKYSAHPDSPDYNENDEIAKFSIIKPAIFVMADLINSYFPDTFKEADLNREDPNHTADVVEAYCKENNLPLLLDRDMEISPDIEDRAVFVELAALKDALEELKKKQLPPIDLDEKVFNKWANCRIKPLKLPYQFERISTEISDPEKLSDLSTALADGRQPIEKTLPVILDFLHNEEFLKEGTATTPEMLSGDELKPKLDFIWNLIIKFQITAALNQPTYEPLTDYEFDKAPLTFLQNTSKETGVKGLRPLSVAMLTLISLYYPEKVPQINKDNEEEVLNNLFKVCEENDFPILLDREDFANPATGKVTLTQLSLLKSTLAIRKNNDLEKAVFTRWANIYTKDRGITLDDITEDATDPTKLIALVEGLTGKSPNDKTVAGTLDLLHKQDGLKDETTPEQLTGDTSINLPKKLDFLWNLVIRYQITAALKSQNYHPSITPGEFQLSVEEQTGVKGIDPLALALLKIVASYYPDQVDNSKLDPSNHEQLNNYLCEISENNQYPLILTLNDFNSGNITNRVALTQLSLFKNYFYIRQIKETECHALARWANFKVKDRGIEFDLLANDLSNNEKLYVLANELSGKTPSNRTVPGSLELLQREDGLKDSTTAEQLTGKDWNRRVDFLWSLVVRYQITAAMSENNTSSPDYTPEQTPNDYRAKEQENIKIKELRPVPLSMLVLISQFYPEQADPSKVDQSSVDGLLKTLIPLCESNNYPLLLTEEEFKIHLTDRVVLTQLAVLHCFLVAKKIADEEAARKAAEEEAARLAAEEAARLAAEEAARKAAEEAARKAAEEEAARLAAEEAARLAAEEAARKAAEEEAARLAAEEAARKAAEEEAARLAAEEAARKAAEEEAARLAAEEAARKAAEEEAARKAAEEEAARLAAEEAARKAAEEAARKAAEEEAARKAAEEAAARKAAEDAENAKRAAEEAERKAALLLEKNILARWATYTTRYHNVNFNNFSKDIATADKLTILARVLTNKQPAQKGVPGALDHLHKADGLKDDTTPQQINGKDDSLKYNFVWNLIIKYQISAALDDQHNKPDPNYDPSQTPVLFQQKVQKETNSENLRPLQLACLSLIARYMPSKVNLSTIDTSNNEAVLQQLLDTAQANQLPLLLTKEDFGQPITDKVALTQLALLKSGIYLRLNEEFESKVFSRWATIESRKVNITFENIVEEISDAEKFSGLVFALSGKQTQQKTVASTLDLLHKNEGLIDRTSSAHLAGKDFKIKLEFVWGLVIRYLITAALNEKTHKPLPNYKPDQTPVQFFQAMQKKTSVQNLRPLQLALLVLIHYYFPNVVNAATIEELKNADKNRQLEQLAQVCRDNKYPLVLDNEDFSKQLSARIILTQVALFNHYLAVRKEEELQAQVFSKWANLHLQARGIQLDEIDMNQLGQGQNFSVLIELLSQKDVPDKSFKGALGFLRNEKVPYVVQSINPDVDDFNLMDRDVQFDLLYSLIDRYEVQENPQEFKNWCRSEDGSASSGGKYLPYTMAALVAKYHPEAIKLATLDRQNIPATVDVVLPVCNHLGAPLLLSRDEYLSDVSDKVYYTQLAVLKSFFERQLKEQQEARRRLAREVEGKIYCRWANLKLNKSHQQPEESEEAETPAYQVTVPQDFKDDPTKLYILTHKLTASEGSEDVQPTNVDQLNSILRNNNFKGHQISGDQLQSEGDEAIDNFLFDLIVRYTLLEVNGINKEQRKRANYSEEQAIQAFVKWLNANIRNNTEPLSRAIVAILAKYYPQDVKGINPNQTDKAALELCKNLDIPLLIDNEEEFACNPYLSPKAKVAVLASLKDAIESKNRPEEEEPMVVQERGIGLDLDNDEESNRLRPLPTENIESPLLQENLPGDEPLDRVPPRNNNINYLWVIIPLIVIGALLPTVSNLL